MAELNESFFEKKRDWSLVKDALLNNYFTPYMQKVLCSHKPIVYIDCFAGKGKFKDGQNGSPLIALEIIDNAISSCKCVEKVPEVSAYFIEKHHHMELEENINSFSKKNNFKLEVVKGSYEKAILEILSKHKGENVFLYIDPYGIKALNTYFFDQLVTSNDFKSIEILLNFNSFGFVRCAASVLSLNLDDLSIFDDLLEVENSSLENNSEKTLNTVAGGMYWRNIIKNCNKKNQPGKIDGILAENIFSNKYYERLTETYKYVLNMPICLKKGQIPKYRMFHLTNHSDGCFLMANTILKCTDYLGEIQSKGQLSLFEEDIDLGLLRTEITEHLKNYIKFTRIHLILADYYIKYGLKYKPKDIYSILRELENNNHIEVLREPKYTKENKPSRFFTEKNKQTVEIRWNQ